MNKSLLFWGCLGLLLGTTCEAKAQLGNLVGAGINLARHSSGSSDHAHQQKAMLFVMPATFGTHSIPQKRTPASKLPKPDKGGTEIQSIEQLLGERYLALQADSTAVIISVEQEKTFSRLRANLEEFNSFWNTAPYSEEMNFYRWHDDMRRRLVRSGAAR